MRPGLFPALLVAFCGFSGPVEAQGPPYTFVKLQVPGSIYTDATGINNSGHVVGTYYTSDFTRHGYVFDGNTYTTVDFPGAVHTFLFGIDASGRAVGSYSLSNSGGPWHSLMVEDGNFSSFDFPNRETDARAINGVGRIVGIYNSGPGTPDTGYLKIDDSYESISVSGATHTYALGINDASKIVGSYAGADGVLRGFMQNGPTLSTINFPLATQTFVGGINNADAMIGWSQKGSNAPRGFLMSGSRMRAFDVNLPGAVNGQPQALNDPGQVVGNYFSPECPLSCGFLATPQIGGVPACDQTLSLQYFAGTLTMRFVGLKTSAPFAWRVSLLALNTAVPLWSVALPAVPSPASRDVPFSFPAVGWVFGVSILSNAAGEAICADFAVVNTSI
jgi:probable HAF family extracellular repeat protein